MIKPKNKYHAFGYFGMAIFYYVAFAVYLLSGGTPRGDYQKDSGYFWTYISILFLFFLYQAIRGIYLYWCRIRRDTDPIAQAKSFSPRTASLITSVVMIPIGLCFLILPIVELVKKTTYGGNVFGNHSLASEPTAFWGLLILQSVIAFVPILGGILLFIFPPRHINAAIETLQTQSPVVASAGIKTSTKIIIGSVITIVLFGFLAVGGIAFGLNYFFKEMNTPERTEKRNNAKAAGLEFAKTTDQNGCLEKGFSLNGSSDPFDISNKEFLKNCLDNSRPTADFCKGVPFLFSEKWIRNECKTVGHDTRQCDEAFSEKLDFCRMHEEK